MPSQPYGTVNQGRAEYVRGTIYANTIERFRSLLERGVIGAHHKVSAKYPPTYVGKFQFHSKNRKKTKIFRAAPPQAF